MLNIEDLENDYSVSALTATVVDIASLLPDEAGNGEGVSFQFDGLQDQHVYLSNADKTKTWRIATALTFGDAGPFNADSLRRKGLTYIFGGGTLTAGSMSIALVRG